MRKTIAILLCACSVSFLAAQEPRLSASVIGPKDDPAAILTLAKAARVSLIAKSSVGAPISLNDKMEGRIASSGVAGEKDGRIDLSLDPGEYRVGIELGEDSRVAVNLAVRSFSELGGQDPAVWPRLIPGAVASAALKDLQSASYWIELREDGAVEVEALGRDLAVMELWRENQYLVGSYPVREERQIEGGRPMGYACASVPAKAGRYAVRLYGGPGRAWAKDPGQSPLYLRSGFIGMPLGGRLELTVSPFGRDFVLVEGVSTAVLGRATKGTASLAAVSYAPGGDRLDTSGGANIAKDAIDWRCAVEVPQGRALLRIEAKPGESLGLDAFASLSQTTVREEDMRAGGLLAIRASYSQSADLPATGLAFRRVERKAVLAKDFSLPLSGSASIRGRCNLGIRGERSLYIRVEEAGDYQVAEKGGTGQAEASYTLRSLGPEFDFSGEPISRDSAKSATFSLYRGYYLLSVSPRNIGVLDFALFKAGVGRGLRELAKDPPPNRSSWSWSFDPDPKAEALTILAGDGPSWGCGYSFSTWPLALDSGLALELGGGEKLELPSSFAQRGAFHRVAKQGPVLIDGRAPEEGGIVAPGKALVGLGNPGAALASFGFSIAPSFDELPPPRATGFGSGTTTLSPGKSEWRDFGRGDSAVYSFEVKEAAVYVVETLGRLSTSLSLRSVSRLGLFEASANGYGKNAAIRAWLRPGQYYVEAETQGKSAGRGGLRMDRVPLPATVALDLGSVDRRALGADSAAAFSFALAKEEEIELRSTGLASPFSVRLEDAEGFIAYRGEGKTRLRLGAGAYKLYSLPVSIDTNRLTWIRRVKPEEARAPLPGSKALSLNVPASSTWKEGSQPELWSFSVPSALEARLDLPKAFDAQLEGPGGKRSLGPDARLSIALERGTYSLAVRPREKANQLPYSIGVYTSVLAPGVGGISVSGAKASTTKVSVPEDGFYELWSLGRSDVAARLLKEGPEGVLVASSDDNGPDWNFDIVQRLKAGSYRLELAALAGSNEAVELYLTSRRAKAANPAASPYEAKLAMDEAGVILPFDAKSGEGLYRISTSGDSPVSLRLYRGDELVAAGEGELALPLRGGARYSLYAWTSFPESPSLAIRRLPEREASISSPLSLGPGEVLRLRNPEALSATGLSGKLLVSSGIEDPCYDPGASPFSASPSGGWAWAPEGAATAAPLSLAEGEGVVVGLSDVGQGFSLSSSDKALLVSADTRGQFRCGISAKAASASGAAPFAWDASASWSQGSAALLPPGSWKARIWDGERALAGGASRRVGLGIDSFETASLKPLKLGDRDTISVPPGAAVAMDAPACSLSVLMAKGLILSAWKEGDALATRASLDGRTADTLALKACKLIVANRGRTEARLRFAVLPPRSQADDELSAARPFEAVGLPPEGLRLNVKAAEGELLCLAGDAATAELECADGRFLRLVRDPARGTPRGLYDSVPAFSGSLRLSSREGLVRAYLAKSGKEIDALLAQEGSGSGRELGEAAPLSGKGDAFKLRMAEPGYVDLSCSGPGFLSLGGQGIEKRVVVSGSREDMHLFAWLPSGDYAVWQRPARGVAAGGILRADRVASRPAVVEGAPGAEASASGAEASALNSGAAASGASAFIGAREYQAWSFEVKVEGKVGVGIKSDSDGLQGFLYDSRQGLVAAGPLVFPLLKAGKYLLVVKGLDSAPIEYRLVLEGLEGSRLGVPSEVQSQYKAAGGAPASIAVPMRTRSSPSSASGRGRAQPVDVSSSDGEDSSSGDEEYEEGGDGPSDEGEYQDGGDEQNGGDGENEGDTEGEGDYDGE